MSFFWISFIHSLVAFLIVIIALAIANKIVNEDHWKVWKEIILISFLLLLIGIGQFLVRDVIYDNPDNWSWQYFYEEIRNTFLSGILFVFILVPINYLRLNRKHFLTAESFTAKSTDPPIPDKIQLKIATQQKSDDFYLNPNDLIFAKTEANYLEIFLEGTNQPTKLLKRMTLKDFHRQLIECPQFFKTHRSYLVNLHKVKLVKGNAQGYQLYLKNYNDAVPVSRGMVTEFEKVYSKL